MIWFVALLVFYTISAIVDKNKWFIALGVMVDIWGAFIALHMGATNWSVVCSLLGAACVCAFVRYHGNS